VASPVPPRRVNTSVRQAPARRSSLAKEYVSGGAYGSWIGTQLRRLPHPIDDLSSDLGLAVYDRVRKDPQVRSCIRLLQAAILEDGVQLGPAIQDRTVDGYERAIEIKDEAEHMLADLDPSLPAVLQDLSRAMVYGNKVAEQVYQLKPGLSRREMLQLVRLKVKPNGSVQFVVDSYTNVVGLCATHSGLGRTRVPVSPEDILPRSKFLVLTWDMEDSDPRGTSILNAAYTPWWRKYQIMPEWLRYLAQFGGPSLIGFTPEGAQPTPAVDALGNPVLDDDGNPTFTTPEAALLSALLLFQNSTSLALPYSSKVDLIQSSGDGEAFTGAIALCNQEITKAILTQELATENSRNQARAAAQVHQDALDTIVRQGKTTVAQAIVKDILRPWIRYNWGEESLKLCPSVTMGTTEEQDRPETVRAVATLFSSGYIHPSQLPATDRMVGLPVRDLTNDPEESANPNPGFRGAKPGGQPGQDGSPPDEDEASESGNDRVPPTRTRPRQGGRNRE
jgi:hypothetical protein